MVHVKIFMFHGIHKWYSYVYKFFMLVKPMLWNSSLVTGCTSPRHHLSAWSEGPG